MYRPQCILCVMLSSYCSQSSRHSKLRCEESPSFLRSGVTMCAWCSCFSSSSKQREPEIGFSICQLLLQRHRTSSQWIDPTIPGGFWFYLADMEQLSENHPAVHGEFMSENLSISRSTQSFRKCGLTWPLSSLSTLPARVLEVSLVSARDTELWNVGY